MDSSTQHTPVATFNDVVHPTDGVDYPVDVRPHLLPVPGASSCCPCCNCCCKCHGDLESFPSGYRFVPTDEELVRDYLLKKIKNEKVPKTRIADVDIYGDHPKNIVAKHAQASEGVWYFFSPRNRKYVNGSRPDRKAGTGYWKATGGHKPITNGDGIEIGNKRSLVYCADGENKDWMMQEYVIKAENKRRRFDQNDMKLDDFVLCKIYTNRRSGGDKTKKEDQHLTHVANEDENNSSSPLGLQDDVVDMMFTQSVPQPLHLAPLELSFEPRFDRDSRLTHRQPLVYPPPPPTATATRFNLDFMFTHQPNVYPPPPPPTATATRDRNLRFTHMMVPVPQPQPLLSAESYYVGTMEYDWPAGLSYNPPPLEQQAPTAEPTYQIGDNDINIDSILNSLS